MDLPEKGNRRNFTGGLEVGRDENRRNQVGGGGRKYRERRLTLEGMGVYVDTQCSGNSLENTR